MKTTAAKHDFVDAQQMHKNYPNTFRVPPQRQLDKIQKGSTVKVCAYGERFWVIVSQVEGEKITGVVDNVLLTPFLKLDDKIIFEKRNVYTIWEE